MNKTIFIICMLVSCLSMINAEIIANEDFTGQDLLAEAVFPNANRQPTDNQDGTITFGAGAANLEVLSRIELFGAGIVDPNQIVTVTTTMDISPLAIADNDLTILLSDGVNTYGFQRNDPVGQQIGAFTFHSATDANDFIADRVIEPSEQATFNNIVTVDFTLDLGTSTAIGTMSNESSSEKTAVNALDVTNGLTLLLAAGNANEQFLVNNISFQVDGTLINNEVPEPSTYLLCALLGIFGFFRYRKNAKS